MLPTTSSVEPVVTAPVILAVPVTLAPVELTTNTLLTPPTEISALPLAAGISIDVVPLNILSPEMLPVKLALPLTVKSPSMITVAALAVSPSKVTVSVAPTV